MNGQLLAKMARSRILALTSITEETANNGMKADLRARPQAAYSKR